MIWKDKFSIVILFILFINLFLYFVNAVQLSKDNGDVTSTIIDGERKSDTRKAPFLGNCTRCRLLSNSLYQALKNLSYDKINSIFIDAYKLNNAKQSIEFSKVWDKICLDIKTGRDDCRLLAEDNQETIRLWWNSEIPDKSTSSKENIIFSSLCIDSIQVCCPEGHYGSQCLACKGYPSDICSNNGKCAGSGTRLGNGHCVCKKGYSGEVCAQCEAGYYLNKTMHQLNGTVQCLACDASCAQTCFEGGPRGCNVCKSGFSWDHTFGCFDIDECASELPNPCPRNSFCINTEGSYQCYQCDHACDGCDGDGPDSCLKCAQGHVLKEGVCVNPNPKPLIPPYASPARYITYLGLCLVTCIIFRHNIYIASTIGLAVALYIMVSEKSLNTEYGQAFENWWRKVNIWSQQDL